jgi:hypothetical protein
MALRVRNRSGGDGVVTLNVAANRFEPVAFGDAAGFRQFMQRMKVCMPALTGKMPAKDMAKYKRGLDAMRDATISNNHALWLKKRRELRAAQLKALKALGGFF